MQDSRMVLAAEGTADVGERSVRELPRKIHRDLTRKGHGFRAVLGLQVGERDAEEFRDLALDQLDREDLLFFAPEIRERLLREVRLLLEDGHPGLEVRWLDVGDETPLEARP